MLFRKNFTAKRCEKVQNLFLIFIIYKIFVVNFNYYMILRIYVLYGIKYIHEKCR